MKNMENSSSQIYDFKQIQSLKKGFQDEVYENGTKYFGEFQREYEKLRIGIVLLLKSVKLKKKE